MAQRRECSRPIGVRQGWNRLARLLRRFHGVVMGHPVLVMTDMLPRRRVPVMSVPSGVRVVGTVRRLLRMLSMGMSVIDSMLMPMILRPRRTAGQADAQHTGNQAAGQGSRPGAHSSTRTSRIIPASMW